METVLIGMTGSFFILSAWLYEAFMAIKHGNHLDPKFTGFYIIGLVILVYYSLAIDSLPFVVLNGVILVITLFELDIALRSRKRKPVRMEISVKVKTISRKR